MLRTVRLALLPALLLALLVPSVASAAKYKVAVGFGDQNPEMFDNESFQRLGVKKVRYFIKWDMIDRPGELAIADRFVNRARDEGIDVLMHVSTNDLARRSAKLPTVKQYRTKVKALIDRYRPAGVKTWGAWNEANHDTQPTYKNPRRAAQFFLELRKICKGCTIVALDVLDQGGVDKYITRFYSALGKNKRLARIVGIHNYSDTNRNRDRGTRLILRTVRKQNSRARFWLTETGGVVKFGSSFKCNPSNPASAEKRQARAVKFMFTLTKRFRSYLDRLYIYNLTGDDCIGRFDAGVTRRDGSPRPAFQEVVKAIKDFRR